MLMMSEDIDVSYTMTNWETSGSQAVGSPSNVREANLGQKSSLK